MEEHCDVEYFFLFVGEIHYGHEAELGTKIEIYHSVNEFDVDSVLCLTDDAIPESKTADGFKDYVKLMV